MKYLYLIFIFLFILFMKGFSQSFKPITEQDVRSCTVSPHPRLMMTDQRLEELKKQSETDTVLQRYALQMLQSADIILKKPPVQRRVPPGGTMLSTSRECLNRLITLSTAWRWTNDSKYAEAAKENMLNICGFMDWHPIHFLDCAEMITAVSIGYDWLYSWLDDKSRDSIRYAIVHNGLHPGLASYSGAPLGWWRDVTHNWNQVCNSALIIGALAIAENESLAPYISGSRYIGYGYAVIPQAVNFLPLAINEYAPDGEWAEGPGYWNYATNYTVYGMACLQTALGTDFGLSDIPGFSLTAYFPIYCTGPSGLFLNYADSGEKSRRGSNPVLFWLGNRFNNQQFIDSEHEMLKTVRASALNMVWYQPGSSQQKNFDLDKYFQGKNALAIFRSAWDDPDALYVGIKAGYNSVNHAHLDLGNFELDALGVRWVRDLGSENYSLPGFWDYRDGGQRFTYYRNSSFSHSVPLINEKQQLYAGTASMIKTSMNVTEPYAILDITEAYKRDAQKVWRGLKMVDNRKAVLIHDEYILPEKGTITWAIVTDAAIKLKGNTAELTLEGKQMIATICEPAKAVFSIESAEQSPPEHKNEGVKKLLVKLDGVYGSQSVAVLLSPVGKQGTIKKYQSKPLSTW